MARHNTRFRLTKALAETGGSTVACRIPKSREICPITQFLDDEEMPGYYAFVTVIAGKDGEDSTYFVSVSDPNVAFALKMRFG